MYHTVKDLAERLKCSEKVVYGMIRRGELFAFKIGQKEYRISDEAINAWAAEQRRRHDERRGERDD
ncbi:helix-turn-helix domain-containing protein [Deinococcus yavapaiensis]|uniref:Excisionase family DNA binding protein n=1 Tax=Deinococcus yavapaiensis KR-236 TaxID=694435 RepID=A0A318SN44_9DEIO|nr:helix-turn-helix domain-containing protein [Deinococcus yavapaiensis]PYE54079.1 excisionase family DNA binding protein [Deinococcus yavapaiensis KR-236]